MTILRPVLSREGVRKCTDAIHKSLHLLLRCQDMLEERPPNLDKFLKIKFSERRGESSTVRDTVEKQP